MYNYPMNIDFIYFDVGGVVVLDFSKTNKWDEMLCSVGISEKDKARLETIFDSEEPKFCRGEKSIETFVDVLKNEFSLPIPQNYSFLKEFVSRFEPNPSLSEIISSIKSKYRIGLLTNMYPGMLKKIKEKGLLPKVEWDVIVDSSEVGFLKPRKEIFSLAERLAGVHADRILFVENSQMHIDAASEMGWNTLLYDPASLRISNEKLTKFLESSPLYF